MEIKKNLCITESEAIKLLTASFSDENDIKIFDNYGNYSFPTDITMNTPNNACGTTASFITNSSKNSF